MWHILICPNKKQVSGITVPGNKIPNKKAKRVTRYLNCVLDAFMRATLTARSTEDGFLRFSKPNHQHNNQEKKVREVQAFKNVYGLT